MSTRSHGQVVPDIKWFHSPESNGLLHKAKGPDGIDAECHSKRQMLQRKPINNDEISGIPPIAGEVLSMPGQPLDAATRAFLEPRFGYDFSRVRVHSDPMAAEAAQAVNALAYTVGSDIVFGANRYSPELPSGRRLLTHELAHVVQQTGLQGKDPGQLKIGDSSDEAERAAGRATGISAKPPETRNGSVALEIRQQLRHSRLAAPTIQRAVKTWGGEFKTDKYLLTKDPGMDGVEIELRFKPNKHADAELIGMTQTARSLAKGSPVPTTIFGAAASKALSSRTIPSGEAGAGTRVDRISTHGNPLYATDKPGAGDALSSTPTDAFWGQHGWRYTDKAGKLKEQDALLKDRPQLSSTLKESSQTFETTALAVKGVQNGTFYGSVQWGWQKNAAGKTDKLPLKLVSKDVPSAIFARASEFWNKAKTSEGKPTIDLPIVAAKYTNTQGVWLVSNPSHYKTTIIGKLAKNTRLEVTNKGTAERFNKTADKYKWWKVTIVDGTHIGRVGWVMQADLSDAETR